MPPSAELIQETRTSVLSDLLEFASKPFRQLQQQPSQATVTLNDGHKIPLLGLGTWNAQGKELKEAVKRAIYAGYRHIDTASNYRNETIIGEAIAECIDENVVSRRDLYITTKLWNNSHSRNAVPRALQASLQALGLSYVDLYLIHYPIGYKEGGELSPVDERGVLQTSDVDYVETWLGMQDVKHLGLTRSIGVSNFNKHQIARILYHCTTIPAMNQVECHPYLNQADLIDFCLMNKIQLTAYSPLGSPGKQSMGSKTLLIKDPVVKYLAKKYHATAGQVLIRYQLQRNIAVIPKAIQPAHIKSNLGALSLQLSPEDMDELDSLDCSHRFMLFERCIGHPYYPFGLQN